MRTGMTLPNGGLGKIERIRAVAQSELGWDDPCWTDEVAANRNTWTQSYSPAPSSDPG